MTNSRAVTMEPRSRWRRWLAELAAFEEAMCLSSEEIQGRRIVALEARLAALEMAVPLLRGSAPGRSAQK